MALKVSEYTAITTPLIGTDLIEVSKDLNEDQSEFETQKATIDDLKTAILGYKKYVALLTQSGTDAPVATILENTLSGTPVWSYIDPGLYEITLSSEFTIDKTFVLITTTEGNTLMRLNQANVNTLELSTTDLTGIGQDGVLEKTPIEIRVYQ